jgi:hypothetical protein
MTPALASPAVTTALEIATINKRAKTNLNMAITQWSQNQGEPTSLPKIVRIQIFFFKFSYEIGFRATVRYSLAGLTIGFGRVARIFEGLARDCR